VRSPFWAVAGSRRPVPCCADLKRFNRAPGPPAVGRRPAKYGKATIRDVASKAGVAVGTVSHHLNASAPVAALTARRIERAIAALGYRINLGARGLRSRRTHSAGLVLPNISNPFYSEIARAIEHALWAEGLQTLLCDSSQDPGRERLHLEALESRRVDGILIIRSGGRTARDRSARADVPVVFVDRAVEGAHSVTSDNRLGGELAARHLAELGHRHIGVLAGESRIGNVRQRMEGFRAELARHGITLREADVIAGPQAIELGYRVTDLLSASPRPTAIFATNDIVAIGAWRKLIELGLRIPQDISLVGFDDIEMSSMLLPPLTTVRQEKPALGREAAGLLIRLLRGEKRPPQTILIETTLVVRASTAAPPAGVRGG